MFSASSYDYFVPRLISHDLDKAFPKYQDNWHAIKFSNLLTHPHPTSSFSLILSADMTLLEVRDLLAEEFSIKNVDEVRFKIKKRKELVNPNDGTRLRDVKGVEGGVVVVKDMGKEFKGGWFLEEEFSAEDKKNVLPNLLFKTQKSSNGSKKSRVETNSKGEVLVGHSRLERSTIFSHLALHSQPTASTSFPRRTRTWYAAPLPNSTRPRVRRAKTRTISSP